MMSSLRESKEGTKNNKEKERYKLSSVRDEIFTVKSFGNVQ
jgi:hypothetical protein